jgi:hypothetical protein
VALRISCPIPDTGPLAIPPKSYTAADSLFPEGLRRRQARHGLHWPFFCQHRSSSALLGETGLRGLSEPCCRPQFCTVRLVAFDLVISAESPVAHTLAGQLRDLKVETWALLGIPDAARPSAEIVNACATFEHAYQIIIVLDAQILRLCRALGLPSEKLRRWSDDVAGNDDDWCESLSLSFSASVSD